jgi:hypothetical protein
LGKHPSCAQSKLILKPADILELFEDLLDVAPLAKGKKATRRKQMKSSAHGEE